MTQITTVSESFVQLCKERKETLGITNSAIAEKTGIPESTVTKLFNGTIKSPSLETVLPIANLLNISLNEMAVIEDNPCNPSQPIVQPMSAVSPIIDQLTKQLTDAYDKQLKMKRESFEKQLKQNSEHYERQIKIINESHERYVKTLIDGYERPIRNKNKWIIALATVMILTMISLVVAVIYDIVNPDVGWIRRAVEMAMYGLDGLDMMHTI